jgi:hypothetical protein
MRISTASSRTLTVSVTFAMLAGCSGGSSQLSPTTVGQNTGAAIQSAYQPWFQDGRLNAILAPRRSGVTRQMVKTPSVFSPDAKRKPLIFVSDYNGNVVNIYLQERKHKMVGQITGLNGPGGLAIDAASNLYVINQNNSTVAVYAPPYTGAPKQVLDDSGYFPNGVAVSHEGVVGVANDCKAPSCPVSSATITFYIKNATTSCANVSVPAAFHYLFVDAFDEKGNLYFAGSYSPGTGQNVAQIGEVKGGCHATKAFQLTTGNSIHVAEGLQVDKAGRIAFLGQSAPSENIIYTYNPPKKRSLGNPFSTTPLTNYVYILAEFKFNASGTAFYTAESQSGGADAFEYAYPAGGNPEVTFPVSGYPAGVAVTPPLVP